MYYPDEVIEEVRSRNDIVDVISQYVKLTRRGANYFGLCPFHNEKTGSFSVSPSKQMFYCFGCGAGGNVVTFIMKYENYTFQEAVKYLADRAGIKLPEEEYTPEAKRQHDLKTQLLEINKQAGVYYYYLLHTPAGQSGMAYLKKRELSDETIKSFGLGYAGKYSDALYKYLKSKGYKDEVLLKSGLVTMDKERIYDKFWNRVMFPIMDVNNRVIGFGGRVMGDAKPKYLNSPETMIFDKSRNLYGLNVARRTKRKFLIVCEGYMDVISMHQAGFTNAVASLGTSLTLQHCTLLKRYTDEVLLSYDSDGAGIRAALRAIPMVKEAGLKAKILHLEPAKDPDEFIKTFGAEDFEERLRTAENSFSFELTQLEKQFDMKDPEDKTRFFRVVARKIAGFELEVERDNYIDATAERYSTSVSGLRKMVMDAILKGTGEKESVDAREDTPVIHEIRKKREQKKEDGIITSERLLLTWAFDEKGFFATLKKYIQPEDYSTPLHRTIAEYLYGQLEHGTPNAAWIIDQFQDPEEQSKAAAILNAGLPVTNQQGLVLAMKENIRKVMEASLRRAQEASPADVSVLQMAVRRKKEMEELKHAAIQLEHVQTENGS